MKTFLIINLILISFTSCSYYSKNIQRKHLNSNKNVSCPYQTNLIQENSTEISTQPKENIT